MQDLRENSEKNSDEDEAFEETEWPDFTNGFSGRLQKRVTWSI